jgi:hypothetical protein
MAVFLECFGMWSKAELIRSQRNWVEKPLGSDPTKVEVIRWMATKAREKLDKVGWDPQRLSDDLLYEVLWFHTTLDPFVSATQDFEPVAVQIDGDVSDILRRTKFSTRNFNEALDLLAEKQTAYIDFPRDTAPDLVSGWPIRAIVMTSRGGQDHATWAIVEHRKSGRLCRASWCMSEHRITSWIMLNFIATPKQAEVARNDDRSISRIEEAILASGQSCEEVLQDVQRLAMNALLLWQSQGSKPPQYARSHPRAVNNKHVATSRKRSADRLFTPVSLTRPQTACASNDNELRGGYKVSCGVFAVRGHYRWQACGPKHSERRLIWIAPFNKGSQGANDNEPPPSRPRLYIVR